MKHTLTKFKAWNFFLQERVGPKNPLVDKYDDEEYIRWQYFHEWGGKYWFDFFTSIKILQIIEYYRGISVRYVPDLTTNPQIWNKVLWPRDLL